MPPPLSDEVREEIAEYFIKREDISFIHTVTTVSVTQINRMRRYWENLGEVTPPKHVDQGRSAILARDVVDDLLFFLSQRPNAYLDEMRWFIWDEYDIEVSETTIWRALQKRNWTRKNVYKIAQCKTKL